MVSKSLSALVAFVPAIALANAFAAENPETQAAALDTLSVAELCAARASPDAWDELERRNVFDRGELRDIRKEQVKKGISENVLLCLLGTPDNVVPGSAGETSEAFVYMASSGFGAITVQIDRKGDDATVNSVANEWSLPDGASGHPAGWGVPAGYSGMMNGTVLVPNSESSHRSYRGCRSIAECGSVASAPR